MNPIHLNLASRPYRDYRPVYAVVVAMSLIAAFLMLNNIETYYRYINETQTTRTKIANVEAQARQERQSEEAAKNLLSRLDLERLDQQTKFVNARLIQRAFSWSTLLDELESVLADDVRLTAVTPRFSEEGPIDLVLAFQSKSSNGMITTINRMHADPEFSNPFPSNETQIEGGYTFNLTARYLPPNLALTASEVRR
ncbi:MAG TPA: hypothetical protein VF701_07285 [Thermoanaerobaculia bacterium]